MREIFRARRTSATSCGAAFAAELELEDGERERAVVVAAAALVLLALAAASASLVGARVIGVALLSWLGGYINEQLSR